MYNLLIRRSQQLPVTTIIVLLRPRASGPAISGKLVLNAPSGGQVEFTDGVLRIWELTTEEVLAAGPGAWPLLPLVGKPDAGRLDRMVSEIEPRVEEEVSEEEAGAFWTTMYLHAGLRYRKEVAAAILSGVRQLRDSTTYQAILEEGRLEGRAEEARRILQSIGTRRFGKPPAGVVRKLRSSEVELLERMIERVAEAASWDDVLVENGD